MPFTFAHPAIVLPFYRNPAIFSFTGLVIGSMSPDFEYFLRMKILSNYGHSFIGIFLFDLPIALLVATLFHNIIRPSLIHNLPGFLYQRFSHYGNINWNQYIKKHWFIVITSILIGISSHLFWDAFTHQSGYFVRNCLALRQQINVNGISIPIFKILQHGSSLVGLSLITYFIYQLPKNTNMPHAVNHRYWLSILLITSIVLASRLYILLPTLTLGYVVVSAIMAFFIALVVTPLIIKAH